jgi:hypothetical protein
VLYPDTRAILDMLLLKKTGVCGLEPTGTDYVCCTLLVLCYCRRAHQLSQSRRSQAAITSCCWIVDHVSKLPEHSCRPTQLQQ